MWHLDNDKAIDFSVIVWFVFEIQVYTVGAQKLFWPLTVWINCSSDLKTFANCQPSASNFKSFSHSLEQFFSQ